MILYLESEHYSISGTRALIVWHDEAGAACPALSSGSFTHNMIAGLPEVPTGPVSLTLFDCVVASSRTNLERPVAVVGASGILVADEVDRERAYIDLPPCAFLRLILVDDSERLAEGEGRVGLATPHGTIEGLVNADGYLDIFVQSGPATAYVCSIRGTQKAVVVEEGNEDAGVVVLRVPPLAAQ